MYFWKKGNKHAQKWQVGEVVRILHETYQWLKKNEKVHLKSEIFVYLAEEHGIGKDTFYYWIRTGHKEDERVQILDDIINDTLEIRLIYNDTGREIDRHIRLLVLQNRHDYSERKLSEITGKDGKDFSINIVTETEGGDD